MFLVRTPLTVLFQETCFVRVMILTVMYGTEQILTMLEQAESPQMQAESYVQAGWLLSAFEKYWSTCSWYQQKFHCEEISTSEASWKKFFVAETEGKYSSMLLPVHKVQEDQTNHTDFRTSCYT